MTKPQKESLLRALKAVQDARRLLDKEAAKGLTGVAEFNCAMQLDEAIWGLMYAEKAVAALFDKDDWLSGLTTEQRSKYGYERPKKR